MVCFRLLIFFRVNAVCTRILQQIVICLLHNIRVCFRIHTVGSNLHNCTGSCCGIPVDFAIVSHHQIVFHAFRLAQCLVLDGHFFCQLLKLCLTLCLVITQCIRFANLNGVGRFSVFKILSGVCNLRCKCRLGIVKFPDILFGVSIFLRNQFIACVGINSKCLTVFLAFIFVQPFVIFYPLSIGIHGFCSVLKFGVQRIGFIYLKFLLADILQGHTKIIQIGNSFLIPCISFPKRLQLVNQFSALACKIFSGIRVESATVSPMIFPIRYIGIDILCHSCNSISVLILRALLLISSQSILLQNILISHGRRA